MLLDLLINQLRKIGQFALKHIKNLGSAGIMLFRIFTIKSKSESITHLTIKQLYAIGVLSLIIILVAGFFVGMVLGLQGFTTLSSYGSQQAVGQLVALSLLRELGPVVTGLLFAGRAGSAVTAEIGLMKTTEQLSSLEMIGVDPLKQIIMPRFLAGFICLPILTCMFNAVGIFGAAIVSIEWLGLDGGAFWSNMQQSVYFYEDVINGLIKSVVFGFVVIWIATFQGYNSKPTSYGISIATTKTVVYSSLAILSLDFILTALMFGNL